MAFKKKFGGLTYQLAKMSGAPQQGGPAPVSSGMIVSAPQVDTKLAAGIGLVFASLLSPQGASVTASYTYGTHATAIYNAEAVKTQIRGSAPGQQGPTVRSFVSQPPQQDFTQQSSIYRPLPASQGKLGSMVVSAPQLADLTQQSVFRNPQPANQGNLGVYIRSASQADPTQVQSQITSSQPAAVLTKLGAFVITSPQSDLTQQSQFYSIQASAQAPFSGASYTFGTHAVALYNAEAVKTQIYPSVRPLLATSIGTFITVPPQNDLTQQSQIYPSARTALVTSLGAFINTALQIDLTQQSVFSRSVPGIQGSTVRPNVPVPPQNVDLTQQSQFYGIQASPQAPFSGTSYTFGTHAAALYNAEAIKTQIYPSVRPPPAGVSTQIGTFINSIPPNVDLTIQSKFYSASANPGGFVLTWITSGPDPSEYVQLQSRTAASAAASLTPQPVVKSFVSQPPQQDFTLKSSLQPSAPGIQGPTIRPNVPVPPQSIDLTQQSVFTSPALAFSYALKPYTSAPQNVDLTIQSVIIPSSPGQQGRTVTPNVPVPPQLVDLTQQSQIYKPLALPQRPLLTSYFSTPQLVDLTQQSSIYKPLLTFQGRVPPYTLSAPQLVDLTQQSIVNRSVPSPISYGLKFYTSGPQLVDLTIQSQIYPSVVRALIFGPTVRPNPFVPAQFDITVNGTRIWTPSTFTPPPVFFGQPTIKGGRVILSSKKPSEAIIEQVDFISQLGPGETLLTAVCTCSVYTGVDANPSAMISGVASIGGTIVSQLVIGGVLGTIYEFLATVTTSLGQKIELAGYLAVIPDLI